jgi:hypothetical protein
MTHDARFDLLTFEDFRRLATDDSLSRYEKIGFPDAYRQGYEERIFADIEAKLPALGRRDQVVVDIGPGCSELPLLVRRRCEENGHTLVLIDSEEMLAHHPAGDRVFKFAGRFPASPEVFTQFEGRADAIIVYSVLHYVFPEASVFTFLDRALALLSHGGGMIVGDVPNVSKRRRFFSSPAGQEFHRAFTQSTDPPPISFNALEPGKIDDSVLLALVARAREAGFDAYLVPQADGLPMANRREDLVIYRP